MSVYAMNQMYRITLNINNLPDDDIESLLDEIASDENISNTEYCELYSNVMKCYQVAFNPICRA